MNQNPRMIGLGFILLVVICFLVVMYNGKMDSRSKTGGSLTASRNSESSVPSLNLGWTEGEPSIVDYVLHWGPASGQYDSNQHVGLVNATSLAYPTVQTFYVVSGVDSGGLESMNSNEIAVGPLAAPSPTPPLPTPTATATVAPPSPSPTATATATAGPDFSLVIPPPTSRTVPASGGSPSFSVKLVPVNGFNKPVMLSYDINGMPAVGYIGAKWNSQPLTISNKSSTFTASVLDICPAGTYVVTVTGNSGIPPVAHSVQYTVIKTP